MVDYHGTQIDKLVQAHCRWNNWDEIEGKNQLRYLKNYLSDLDSIDCKTIVFENQYVDRFFLEDYSEYYSRCFNRHPRKSARLHFFSMHFNEDEFIDSISDRKNDVARYQEHYLGFVVLRPIPQNVLGRACLAVYDRLVKEHDKYEHKLVTKRYDVSLYGMKLSVNSLAMQEQDKIVSACATSAIWTFFNSQNHLSGDALPSPSAITKTAQPFETGQGRTFPNGGLNLDQITKCLKSYKLEPSVFPINGILEPDTLFDLKAFVKAMISSGTPVLLAGRVYKCIANEEDSDGELKVNILGEHLVCVSGYRKIKIADKDTSRGVALSSDFIDRLYVHDARHGPYQRIDMTPIELGVCKENSNDVVDTVFGLHTNTDSDSSVLEYFVPDYYIVGLYHKIRISEQFARKAVETFSGLLNIVERMNFRDSSVVSDGVWDIELVRGSQYKEEVRDAEQLHWIGSSFSSRKRDFLLQQLPRFMWRLRLSGDEVATDILIDATEIEVGQVMLGFVCFTDHAASIWDAFENSIQDDSQRDLLYNIFQDSPPLYGFSLAKRFFANIENAPILDIEYGSLRPNRRIYKDNELDEWKNIVRTERVDQVRNSDAFSKLMNENRFSEQEKYIWLIDHEGTMHIGQDCENSGSQQGHPTLNNGKPARIAGELKYCSKRKCWFINTWSAAYSQYLDVFKDGSLSRKVYVENVRLKRFGKENVVVDEGKGLPTVVKETPNISLALDLDNQSGLYIEDGIEVGFNFLPDSDSFGNPFLVARKLETVKNLKDGRLALYSGERKDIKRRISEMAANEDVCKPRVKIVWDRGI